jgi:hypothetical protein
MGIATFESELKFESENQAQFEYECWLDYIEQESWIDRMIDEENTLEMEFEAARLLKIDSITEEELRHHLDVIEVRREKK